MMKPTTPFAIALAALLAATAAHAQTTTREEIQSPRGQEIQSPRGQDGITRAD